MNKHPLHDEDLTKPLRSTAQSVSDAARSQGDEQTASAMRDYADTLTAYSDRVDALRKEHQELLKPLRQRRFEFNWITISIVLLFVLIIGLSLAAKLADAA